MQHVWDSVLSGEQGPGRLPAVWLGLNPAQVVSVFLPLQPPFSPSLLSVGSLSSQYALFVLSRHQLSLYGSSPLFRHTTCSFFPRSNLAFTSTRDLPQQARPPAWPGFSDHPSALAPETGNQQGVGISGIECTEKNEYGNHM